MNDWPERRSNARSAWLGHVCLVGAAALFSPIALEAGQALRTSSAPAASSSGEARDGHPQHAHEGAVAQRWGAAADGSAWWRVLDEIWPATDGKTLTWLAVVLVLVLTAQQRASSAIYFVDGIVLGLISVLLLLRRSEGVVLADGHTVQWWTYVLLTAAAGYWLVRGFCFLVAKRVRPFVTNISTAGGAVLLVAGLLLGLCYIRVAPTSALDVDAISGGELVAEQGKLPYGAYEGASTAHSPLVYLLHAGARQVAQPVVEPGAPGSPDPADENARVGVARPTTALVNSLLFVLFVLGLAVTSYQRRSSGMVATAVAIACFLPWTLESLNDPEIMLASGLVAWSLACMTAPAMGGLLSMILLVAAGLAWPWAWLLIPVGLAYFLRRGWQAPGAVIGLLAGVAGCAALLIGLVEPAPPGDRAIAAAGLSANYELRQSGTALQLRPANGPASTTATAAGFQPKRWIWENLLACEDVTLGRVSRRVEVPAGIDPDRIRLREVHVAGGRELLVSDYRAAVGRMAPAERAVAGLRTVLEDMWLGIEEPAAYASAWDVWRGDGDAAQWDAIRRYSKAAAGVLSLVVAFMLLRGARPTAFHFAGGVTAVLAAILIVSASGATMNWVWLLPGILAMISCGAASGGTILAAPAPVRAAPASARPAEGVFPAHLPAPRITVE